jgi:hypothetical protein
VIFLIMSVYECYDAYLKGGDLNQMQMTQLSRDTLTKFIEVGDKEMVIGDIQRKTGLPRGTIMDLRRIKKTHDRNMQLIFQRTSSRRATTPGVEFFFLPSHNMKGGNSV